MGNKFKVGDRVECTCDYGNVDAGMVGTVRGVSIISGNSGVEWDALKSGHDCGGMVRTNGKGWYVPERYLKLAQSQQSITITHDGRRTVAKWIEDGKTIKTKSASHNIHGANSGKPFDFEIGARLVFARLLGLPTDGILAEDKPTENKPRVIKQDKYEVGDKVLIVDEFTRECRANSEGTMDKWLGKVMTIRAVDRTEPLTYLMEEDNGAYLGSGWYWHPPTIAGKVIEEPAVREVKRRARVGEYIKIVSASLTGQCYKNGRIAKVQSRDDDGVFFHTEKTHPHCRAYGMNNTSYAVHGEYVVLEGYKPEAKPEFKPYLWFCGGETSFGELGAKTEQVDLAGETLCVGDTVTLFHEGTTIGERPVCCVAGQFFTAPSGFVCGVGAFEFKNGRSDEYSILKKRSYSEIKDGEIIDDIEYIKTEETANGEK